MSSNIIMKGYYINLECRRDRRRHIENNILTLDFFKDLERFEGIKKPYGIGCNESWLKVLEKCLSMDTEDRFLLIEDDIHIYDMEIFNNFIEDYKGMENINWDIIHLTPRLYDKCRNQETLILESGDKYSRLHNCVTATGLIIKKEFIPILMKNLQYSTEKLKKTLNTPKYIIDISWLDLQEKYRIYGYNKSFCYQLECLSDINMIDEKYIGMYKTWGMDGENRLSKLLLRYINNPHSDYNCFYLAREYEIEGQNALAVSYYLKCCDNTIYDELVYESLIRIGYCFGGMSNRDEKSVNSYEHAISVLPDRPEAYYILSLHYSWRGNFKKGYMYSQLAIHNSDIKNYPLYFETQYKGVNHSLFQKAHTASKIGRMTESIKIYEDLLYKNIDENLRNVITDNLNHIYSLKQNKTQENYKIQENKKEITKIIHQTWEYKYDELNEDMKVYVDSWKTHNNNYEHILYDKNDRISFIRENFDDNVLNSYNKLKPGAFKCDLWRYCILYIYGGYYVDLDTLCLDSLDKLPCSNFLCSIDISWNEKGTYQLANGFIGSNKGNPILKMCIDYIVDIVMSDKIEMIYPIDIAGPGCLGICMNKYLGNNPKSSFTEYGYINNNNNIYLLNFDKDTEYMGISNDNIWILQNKNGNMSLKKSYDNECKKIKDYFDWGKFGHGLVFKKKLLNDSSVINKNLPELIVIDNFYKDPDSIRKRALDLEFLSEEYHGAVGHRCERGRLVSDEAKDYFEKILGKKIKLGNNIGEWSYSTNGCFQWCSKDTRIVYHSDSQEYAGIVFLTPDAPVNCGTSIFRHKKYKIKDNSIWSKPDWSEGNIMNDPHLDKNLWEEVDRIGNIYNRLVIFKSHNVHAVSEYFGETINDSRLFQLFFFDVE